MRPHAAAIINELILQGESGSKRSPCGVLLRILTHLLPEGCVDTLEIDRFSQGFNMGKTDFELSQ
jgi:hypothetical protein